MGRTYELKLGCDNCFHKWIETMSFGQDVTENELGGFLKIGDSMIECPNCGSYKTHKEGK